MDRRDVPGKVLTVDCPLDRNFYREWLKFLKPIHNLTPNQMDVFACILYHRYELSKDITNSSILDQVVLGGESRKSIRAEMNNMSTTHFQVVMSALKKNGVIVDGKINPKYIPVINEDTKMFSLSVYFKFK